jgi:hypothetical protein
VGCTTRPVICMRLEPTVTVDSESAAQRLACHTRAKSVRLSSIRVIMTRMIRRRVHTGPRAGPASDSILHEGLSLGVSGHSARGGSCGTEPEPLIIVLDSESRAVSVRVTVTVTVTEPESTVTVAQAVGLQ